MKEKIETTTTTIKTYADKNKFGWEAVIKETGKKSTSTEMAGGSIYTTRDEAKEAAQREVDKATGVKPRMIWGAR